MSEPTPDPVAAQDQIRAGLGDVARQVVAYYAALIDGGIPPDGALTLSLAFQQFIWHNAIAQSIIAQVKEPPA
jgi:hypothetical protein